MLVQSVGIFVADDKRRFQRHRLDALQRPMLELLGEVETQAPQMLVFAPGKIVFGPVIWIGMPKLFLGMSTTF